MKQPAKDFINKAQDIKQSTKVNITPEQQEAIELLAEHLDADFEDTAMMLLQSSLRDLDRFLTQMFVNKSKTVN